MNIKCDLENFPPLDDGEDTYMRRFYLQKRAELEAEMQSLRELKHPKYILAVQKLDEQYKAELETEEISDQLEAERIKEHYEQEKAVAEKEVEERLSESMDILLQECDEQRKRADHEYNNSDITSTPANDFPNKKSLRRRPNEPTPYSEKQMQAKTRPVIVYKLTDQEIQEDLSLLDGTNANGIA